MTSDRKKQCVVRISPELHERLVAYCEKEGRFIHRVSEEIIRDWLDSKTPEKAQGKKKGGGL